MIKFVNPRHVSNETLERMESLAYFVFDKFISKRRQPRIYIEVVFKKGLFKKTGQFANCIWEDTHYRPNEFEIQIDPDQKLNLLLNSIAHEMVHVKQWALGEFYQMLKLRNVYKFNGQHVDVQKIDYWDQPWEIEAHGRAIGLVVQWVKYYNLDPDNLVLEG